MALNYLILIINICQIYISWGKVIRCILRVPYRTHNDIVTKLGGDSLQT